MEQDWHKQLDDIERELNALPIGTDDGRLLVTTLLRLIEILHRINPSVAEGG